MRYLILSALVCALWSDSSPWFVAAAGEEPKPAAKSSPAEAAPATSSAAASSAAKTPPRSLPEPTSSELKIAVALDKGADVDWIDMPLGDVVVQLSEKYGIPIQIDVAALAAEGKGPDNIVTKKIRGVSLQQVLRAILEQHGLAYVVRFDQLVITTETAADQIVRTRIYPVHDLAIMPGLADVAAALSKQYEVPIQLDVGALAADGLGPETLINKRVRGVSLRAVLRLILEEHGLTYVFRHGQVLITTRTAAEHSLSTRVYQVHDLTVMAGDSGASRPNLDPLVEVITSMIAPETWQEAGGTVGVTTRAAAKSFLSVRIYPVHDLAVMPNDPTAARPQLEPLVDLIESTVVPKGWRSVGGTQGEIKEYVGPGLVALAILQTDEGHAEIARLLGAMRQAQSDTVREAQSRRRPGPVRVDDDNDSSATHADPKGAASSPAASSPAANSPTATGPATDDPAEPKAEKPVPEKSAPEKPQSEKPPAATSAAKAGERAARLLRSRRRPTRSKSRQGSPFL